MSEYNTEYGTECTPEECKAIDALQRALSKWNKTKGKRLFLYATGDGINVMMHECDSNPVSEDDNFGSMNRDNIVTLIPVRDIDCGDW